MAGMPAAFGSENNQGGGVNYYPNDSVWAGAPAPDASVTEPPMPILGEAWLKAYDTQDDDNFSQAGDLFRLMSDDQKNQLTSNIAGGLSHASASIQARMLAQFNVADPDYAARIQAKWNKAV
jgi:catalase